MFYTKYKALLFFADCIFNPFFVHKIYLCNHLEQFEHFH